MEAVLMFAKFLRKSVGTETKIFILTEEEAESRLEKQPTGACLLRLDPSPFSNKPCPLILSYKYRSLTFHHLFESIQLTVKLKQRKHDQECFCFTNNKNTFHYIRKVFMEFLPKLQLFIEEFTTNQNYVEMDLDEYPELMTELQYRRFFIYPSGEKIIVKRKKEGQEKLDVMRIAIDFLNATFVIERDDPAAPSVETTSFSSALLNFLEIRMEDEALATEVLQRREDLFKSEMDDHDDDVMETTPSFVIGQSRLPRYYGGKDKDELIKSLEHSLSSNDAESAVQACKTGSQERDSKQVAAIILDSVKTLKRTDVVEKMDWINRKILILLICKIMKNGDQMEENEYYINIIKYLILGNQEGSIEFCRLLFKHFCKNSPCGEKLGVISALSTLIRVEPFRTSFIQYGGGSSLLDLYFKASYELIGEQASSALGKIFNKAVHSKTSMTPRSGRDPSDDRPVGNSVTLSSASTAKKPGILQQLRTFSSSSEDGNKDEWRLSLTFQKRSTRDSITPASPGRNSLTRSDGERFSADSKPRRGFATARTAGPSSSSGSPGGKLEDRPSQEFKSRRPRLLGKETRPSETSVPVSNSPPVPAFKSKRRTMQLEAGPGGWNLNGVGSGISGSTETMVSSGSGITKSEGDTVSPDGKTPKRVPRLNLPGKNDRQATVNRSRSSRRISKHISSMALQGSARESRSELDSLGPAYSARGLLSADEEETPMTSLEEMRTLANKLGEAFLAADLTALTAYKESDALHISARKKVVPQINSGRQNAELAELTARLEELKELPCYKVKVRILHILATLSTNRAFREQVRNPCNVLFSELVVWHKVEHLRLDEDYCKYIYRVLHSYADEVEYAHRCNWKALTKGMSDNEKAGFRRRLDTILFRLEKRLYDSLESQKLDNIELYLALLSEYMQNCPTRVMASQVLEVCLETLLRLKSVITSRGIGPDKPKAIQAFHRLLTVFDELATQNKHPRTNELLLDLLYEDRVDTFNFIRRYAQEILLNKKLEAKIISDRNGQALLEEYRLRIIKHYGTCYQMIKIKFEKEEEQIEKESGQAGGHFAKILQKNKEGMLRRLETLVQPRGGCMLTFLEMEPMQQNAPVKIAILNFLNTLFSDKLGTFVRRKRFIDTYIPFHYISFIKLYNSQSYDQTTLTLCTLHLQNLLCFAQNKNEKIIQKFYQLRVMDFLVLKITLEYEINFNREKFLEQMQERESREAATDDPAKPALSGRFTTAVARPTEGTKPGRLTIGSRPLMQSSDGSSSSSIITRHPEAEKDVKEKAPVSSQTASSAEEERESDKKPVVPALFPIAKPATLSLSSLGSSNDDLKKQNVGKKSKPSSDSDSDSAGESSDSEDSDTDSDRPAKRPPKLLLPAISIKGGLMNDAKLQLKAEKEEKKDGESENEKLKEEEDEGSDSSASSSSDESEDSDDSEAEKKSKKPAPLILPATVLKGSSTIASKPPIVENMNPLFVKATPQEEDDEENEKGEDKEKERENDHEADEEKSSSGSDSDSSDSDSDDSAKKKTKLPSLIIPASLKKGGGLPLSESTAQFAPKNNTTAPSESSNSTEPGPKLENKDTSDEKVPEEKEEKKNEEEKEEEEEETEEDESEDSESSSSESESSEDEKPKKKPMGLAIPPNIIKGGTGSKINMQSSSSSSSDESSDSSDSESEKPKKRALGLAIPANIIKGGLQPSLPKVQEKEPEPTDDKDADMKQVKTPEGDQQTVNEEPGNSIVQTPKKTETLPEERKQSSEAPVRMRQNSLYQPGLEIAGSPRTSSPRLTDRMKSFSQRVLSTERRKSNPPPPAPFTKAGSTILNIKRTSILGISLDKDKSSPTLKRDTSASAESELEEEDAPLKQPSFVPALNLAGVKKKGDGDDGKKEEKKGILGNFFLKKHPSRNVRIGSADQRGSQVRLANSPPFDAASDPSQGDDTGRPSMMDDMFDDSLGYYDVDQSFKGFLSNLERRMNTEDPKLQLLLGNPASRDDVKNQGQRQNTLSPDDLIIERRLYEREREDRKIYRDKELHLSMLQLIFSLMLAPNNTLEPLYNDQFPLDNKKLNIPFYLNLHLNHEANAGIIPDLVDRTLKMGASNYRLLKLLCRRLFDASAYKNLIRIGNGAYGQVYRASLESEKMEVAVKMMAVPKSIHYRCVLHDIFTEIMVMDKFKNDPKIVHLLDYGVDEENFWIIMRLYKDSLKGWLKKQRTPWYENLPLYLNIYEKVLETMLFLTQNHVNHYDIKCDNFLCHPINPDTSDEDFYNQSSDTPNFTISLADFGEAKFYTTEEEGFTTRNRGTEFIKSPEMLVIANASQKQKDSYDRRKKVGANSASDIWSLGCLLFELLTGQFLFFDPDWVRFFIRVTSPGQELITAEKKAMINNDPALLELLEFILFRNPNMRPTIHDVINRFQVVKGTLLAKVKKTQVSSHLQRSDPKGTRSRTFMKQLYDSLSESNNARPTEKNGGSPVASPHSVPRARAIADKIEDQQHKPVQTALSPEESAYFLEHASQITENIYIGSSKLIAAQRTYLKFQLGITHVVNCTAIPNPMLRDHFEYIHAKLQDEPYQDIVPQIPRVIDFIKRAIIEKGKILVYSDRGASRSTAMVLAFLMDTQEMGCYEASIFVKEKRYIAQPNRGFLRQLVRWGENRKALRNLSKMGKQQFQCLCGSSTIALLSDAEEGSEDGMAKLACECKPTQSSECPNVGCASFLEYMRLKHGYKARKLNWGFTTMANVLGDFNHTTVEYVPRFLRNGGMAGTGGKAGDRRSGGLSTTTGSVTSTKQWRLYKCRTCGFVTHAVRPIEQLTTPANQTNPQPIITSAPGTATTATSSAGSRRDSHIAIVMNLIVEHNTPTDYTGSGLLRTTLANRQ